MVRARARFDRWADARNRRDPERGAVAVWVGIFLVPLGAIFAMSFGMGVIMDTRTELQLASDSAALAAARSLNGELTGLTKARAAATGYSGLHKAFDEAISIDSAGADLVFGRWHLAAADCTFGVDGNDCFEPLDATLPRQITAVKILNGRDGEGAHNGPLKLPFGALVGRPTQTLHSSAVAVGGGSAHTACPLPLGLAECQVVDSASNELRCGTGPQRYSFASDQKDGIGFVNLYGDPASGNSSADILRGGCREGGVGDANVQNGNDFSKVIDALRGAPEGKGAAGECWIGPDKLRTLPVIALTCDDGNPKFTDKGKNGRVVGFMQAKILEVTDNLGAVQSCFGEDAPGKDKGKDKGDAAPAGPKNTIVLDIPCDAKAPDDDTAGGTFFNGAGAQLRLVQ